MSGAKIDPKDVGLAFSVVPGGICFLGEPSHKWLGYLRIHTSKFATVK